MIGIGLIIFILIWGSIAVWLGKLLSRTVFARFISNTNTGQPSAKSGLITFLLIALVFLLPILDQLIAYPKWQQMCATTGDFEWGPNMDEKKAFGREVTTKFKQTKTTIFPNIKIEYSTEYVYDAKTQEMIFKKPHYQYSARAFIHLPSSSGDQTAPFLPPCATYGFNGDNMEKKLQLKEINLKNK
jgi:hypothetical protein